MKKIKSFKRKSFKTKKFNSQTSRQKGYDSKWEAYRRRFLHYNKTCYACGVDATVVDHIVAHKGDSNKFKALNNHMPLCKWCHNTITNKFDRSPNPKTKEKIEWINEKRKENNVTKGLILLAEYEKNKR